jgi:cell division protein FtsB
VIALLRFRGLSSKGTWIAGTPPGAADCYAGKIRNEGMNVNRDFGIQSKSRTLRAMDDQYYRKAHPKNVVAARLKKILRHKRTLLAALIVVPVVSFITFSNKGILKRLSLESEKSAMQEKVQAASQEQARLQAQSQSLDKDPRAIEKVAREKYGMVRDGETVYKVKKEK